MKADTIVDKILCFLYFAGIFFAFYSIFVLLFDKVIFNKAKLEWDIGLGVSEPLWTFTYYFAKVISFVIASAISGIIQASYREKRFLFLRIPNIYSSFLVC